MSLGYCYKEILLSLWEVVDIALGSGSNHISLALTKNPMQHFNSLTLEINIYYFLKII